MCHLLYMRDERHAQATLALLDGSLHELVEPPSLVVGIALPARRCLLHLSACLPRSLDTCVRSLGGQLLLGPAARDGDTPCLHLLAASCVPVCQQPNRRSLTCASALAASERWVPPYARMLLCYPRLLGAH